MGRTLLLEIGTEELPASFVARALEALPELCAKLLGAARITHGAMRALGTPRRLALSIADVADAQADVDELVMGPPKSVAIDASGALTKAGEAFAKKLGKALSEVDVVETPKGPYVAVRRVEQGRAAAEVLPELLARLCTQVPFQKSMRWGAGDVAFGRPVQWLVALHGDVVVPFSFAGVESGRETLGHRFLAPAPRAVPVAEAWLDVLREAHVLADPDERRTRMHDALLARAGELGGELIEDAFLLDECLSLVEEPHIVAGGFEAAYLSLPEEVIVAVMRGHQRYFAVRDPQSKALLPRYLTVANTANDPVRIARGNDRVLRARLADARFFVDEDRKVTLAERALKLSGVVFQNKLGTVAEKVQRVSALAESLAPEGIAQATVALAAQLAKADLVSLIVGEFPELQGLMGRYYALAEGIDPIVADAIRDHYLPKGAGDAVPVAAVAALVAVADRLDTLVGCFGIGLVPSGSADPFALRRAALGVVRIALEGPMDVDLRASLTRAAEGYARQEKRLAPASETLAKLDTFFRARLEAFYGERYPTDVVAAVLAAWDGGSLRDLDARLRALGELRLLPQFGSLSVAFKRAYNIAKDVPDAPIDDALLEEPAERALAERFAAVRPAIDAAISAGHYALALGLVASELRGPIDTFFESVFVMVERETLKQNRLRLLGAIARTVNRVAHFHLLVTPG
jgi:glycyl-tRNA synthetase beta chain